MYRVTVNLLGRRGKGMKMWWNGDSRVEPYMIEIKKELDKQGIKGQANTQIYNRAYEAVYKAITDFDDVKTKIDKALESMKKGL